MGCRFESVPTRAEIETYNGGDESEAWIEMVAAGAFAVEARR
jgi:hypothetical protein